MLDPETGAVAPYAGEIIRSCDEPTRVVAESMAYMVETRTSVCRSSEDVRRDVQAMRLRVSRTASAKGLACVLIAVPPFGIPQDVLLADDSRYRELLRRFPDAMSTSGTCACHVHVGVPTRQAGVEVLLRLRRWLRALIALTAGSPIWWGRDAGWASQRIRLVSRWPTAVPAPPVSTVEEYDERVRAEVASGAALDARSVYYFARPSPRYPTVEVRVADVCLTVEETVSYAALVRAIIATVLDDWIGGRPADTVPQDRLRRACLEAARVGPEGTPEDVLTGERVSGWALVDALMDAVHARLLSAGDETSSVSAVARARATGGAAAVQRRRFSEADSARAYVSFLAEAMLPRAA